MEQISIEPLQRTELTRAAAVAARAFSTNPLTVAIYRGQRDKEGHQETAFRHLLGQPPGQVFIAKKDEQLVGIMRMVEWPRCQMSLTQILRSLPIMLVAPRGAALRRLKAMYVSSKHDPREPHWHLSLIAVVPDMQRQGIGSRLLEHFCRHVDKTGQAACLETDKSENIRLYERFGFSVTGEVPVLGVRTWFMRRPQ